MKRLLLCLLSFASYHAVLAQDATPTLVFPAKHLPVGNHVFDVMVKNIGSANVGWNGFKIGWKVDNGPVNEMSPTIPTYAIAPNNEVRVAGNFTANFPTTGTHTLKVWTRLTTGTDANKTNDTIVQQVKILPYVPKKNVVFEVFKHQACCPCIDAAAYEDTAVTPFSKYSVANIYTATTDVLYNAEGDTLNDLFQLAHPTVFFDRYVFPYNTLLENNFFTMNGEYQLRNMKERDRYYEPLEVSVYSASFNTATRLLKVKLKAKVYDTIADNYRFNLYLTEDSVKAYQGCHTPNANDYYHMHVVRKMLGGSWGQSSSLPATLYPNQDYFYEFTYTVPANYNINKMDMIGMVQRYSTDKLNSRIINSANIHFTNALLLSTDDLASNPFGFSIYPNPATDKIAVTGELLKNQPADIVISDFNGKIVKYLAVNDLKDAIDIADLSAASYVLTIKQGNKKQSFKFTKQ
ncbi:MAG TPA: Omp28-related outer membrane protein [Flavipsychrobacter sp.]|nr:Omp28-related outer membrane protein [Flavipsychrobacter sp.]